MTSNTPVTQADIDVTNAILGSPTMRGAVQLAARHRQSSSNAGGVGVSLFDVEPSIGASSPEPSLRNIVLTYYLEHFPADRARELTEAYLASLSTPTAEPTPTPDRIGKEAVREALEDAFCAGWDARHDGQNYYESRDNYVTRALSATPAQEGEG